MSATKNFACSWSDEVIGALTHNVVLRAWYSRGFAAGMMIQEVLVQTVAGYLISQVGIKQKVKDMIGCDAAPSS